MRFYLILINANFYKKYFFALLFPKKKLLKKVLTKSIAYFLLYFFPKKKLLKKVLTKSIAYFFIKSIFKVHLKI
jgi:hypothetical protein